MKSFDEKTVIKFSPGVDDWVIISKPISDGPSDPGGYYRISDSIVKIEIYDDSGDLIPYLNPPVTLVLHYSDIDPEDGIVDGTNPGLSERSLKIYTQKEETWKEVQGSIVNPAENTVSVTLNHFSVYILMGQIAPANHLGNVLVYPNPFKPNDGNSKTGDSRGIIFDYLTENATIKIFNLAGELVNELSGTGRVSWNARNKSDREVASGVYIYLVTDKADNKPATGKFVIIK